MSEFGPRCPNHRVGLVDCHNGVGICPISACRFSYSGDEAQKTKKLKFDAFGNASMETNWNVESIDGEEK